MQMSAQVNPKEGYIITNEGDTIRGTINYLKDEENAKACQFKKAGEGTYKTLSPSDISGYRLADEGIYYVSRVVKSDDVVQRLFAEFLVQGGVSLYRYSLNGETYFGFADMEGKEVVMREDKLNEDLTNYEKKLEARRGQVQQVGSVMSKDPTVAGRLWKMDLTSNALLKMVKRYNERYCTSEGDCVVFKSDTKKSRSVIPHIYIGAAASYAWFRSSAQTFNTQPVTISPEAKYSGIVPTVMVGADMTYPRQSQHLMTQVELSFTPYSIKADDQLDPDRESRMKCSELALRFGVGYVFSRDASVSPFLVGGVSIRHHTSIKEDNRSRILQSETRGTVPYLYNRDYSATIRLGVYASAGVNIGHLRFAATYDLPFGGSKGLQMKGALSIGAAYRF
jgi:hypothetical protein